MRTIVVLGGLLAVALVGSYLTWTQEGGEPDNPDAIPVYVASAADITQLSWKGDNVDVVVERRTDALGEYLWIVSKEEVALRDPEPEATPDAPDEDGVDAADAAEEDPAAEDGGAEAEPEERETETSVVAFLGNEAAQTMFDAFAPLTALRELEAGANSESSAVFGFDAPEATVGVIRRSGPLELTIGGQTYGSKDRYVRYNDSVYLVGDATLRPLEHARTRLVERRLQPLTESDIERIDVTSGAQTLAFLQQNKDDRAAAYWALASAPEEQAELEAAWLDKLFRLRVQAYVAEADAPATLEPVFQFRAAGGDQQYTVDVFKDPAEDDYYARSPYTRSLVSLTKSIASDAAEDLAGVMSAAATP